MVSIQSAWRGFIERRNLDLTGCTIRRRAAVCIQRAWRSVLFLMHLRSLDAAQLLMHSMSAVTVVPNLCLTLLSARMMSFCLQRHSHCLPLHKLKWGFLESTGGARFHNCTYLYCSLATAAGFTRLDLMCDTCPSASLMIYAVHGIDCAGPTDAARCTHPTQWDSAA